MWLWIRRAYTIVRLVSPYILRMVWAMMVASGICIRFFSKGVNEECMKLGAEWTQRTLQERDGLTAYESELLSVYVFAAWLTTLAGWIILAHITVILWRWLVILILL